VTTSVVGRTSEIRAVNDFLSAAQRQPCGLSIEGEPGIGKTTLWLGGVDEARRRGFHVLAARAVQAESVLAYAALADLLRDVDAGVLDTLPEPQRAAIDRVLLRGQDDGPGTDQRAVAAAFVSVVAALAARAPLLVAVDDVQWLDSSSRAVLSFAGRRFTGPVGVLFTERTERGDSAPVSWLQLGAPDGVERLRVGPLSLGGLHTLLSTRLGRSFSRPALVRIAELSDGNPFYALELARTFDGPHRSDGELPASLAELMRARVGTLDPEAGEVLLAAACTADPTVELLARATDRSEQRVVELLETAENNGIVGIDGNRVRFAHPLLARSVYTDASRPDRRRMHRILAQIVTEPELTARHLALAAVSEDPATLQALDAASDVARRRGAPAAAAELLEMAVRLGGDDPARRLRAAEHHFAAGNIDRAVEHLEPTIERLPPGPTRGMALILRAGLRIYHNQFQPAAQLLEQALTAVAEVPTLRLRALLLLAMAQAMGGLTDEPDHTARKALQLAEELDRPALISQALALSVHVGLQFGRPFDEATLRRAVALEDPDVNAPIMFRAAAVNALAMAHIGRLDEAASSVAEVRRRCEERGAESDLMAVAGWSAMISMWRGRYAEALRDAEESMERGQQLGGGSVLLIPQTVRAAACAYLGDVEQARADARAAYDAAVRCESARMAEWPMMTLGFIEVSLGNYADALAVMAPLIAKFDHVPPSAIMSTLHVPEAVEAMAALGRLAEAEAMVSAMERHGRALDRPWLRAVGARGRAMVLAARGDIDEAERMARQALTEHDRLPMPFERARTELLVGQLQRRQRQKDNAATTLRSALRTFEELGTPLWAERARAELARTNVGPGGHAALTPSEQRVAELAASGMTNRDVAAALFISPKTVEHNLGRIYRKLGIRSRAELGRMMGRSPGASEHKHLGED
jgi:ATP/maltotriose-dependent transcriptional regulator MalT